MCRNHLSVGKGDRTMGNYLNSTDAVIAYTKVYNSPYFVDKSGILNEIIPRIGTTENYICLTRPRRFGKSIMANMIAAFFPEAVFQGIFLEIWTLQGRPFIQNISTGIL